MLASDRWARVRGLLEEVVDLSPDGRRSYLADERNYTVVRRLQTANLIVPLVGDFAGPKALRAVGAYLKDHGAKVTAFYTSNVEFYLFQSEDWKRFFQNVADLPMDDNSLFIRAYFNNYGFRFPNQPLGTRSVTLLDSMPGLLAAYDRGQIREYFDVIKRSSR
jgi:hypothetical protein